MTTDTTSYPTTTDPAPSNGTGPATTTRPLADFLPGGPAATRPAVTLPSGEQVVVLRRGDDGQVEVWAHGRILRRDPDTAAFAVADSAYRDDLLAAVVHGLAQQRNAAAEQAAQAERDRDQERQAHDRVLADIRAYAVDKHLGNTICRSGLNDFLEAFGLPVFQPRVRVHYSMTGVYEVDADDADTARRDARGYLKPDLSQLDNVIDDTDTFTMHVESVEELDT